MIQSLKKWILPLLWVLITAALQLCFLLNDYTRVQQQLTDDAGYLFDSVYDRTRLNDVLLQNFSALVDSKPDDHLTLRRFATTIKTRYPHIQRLQIQEQVTVDQRALFEQRMQNLGYDNFSMRVNAKQPNTDRSSTETALFPFTFLEPFNSDTRHLLGLYMGTDPVFTQLFVDSLYSRQPVASHPFLMDDGRSAYTLYQAVYPKHYLGSNTTFHIVSLVISYEGLLPTSTTLEPNTSAALMSADGKQLVTTGKHSINSILPTLSVNQKLNRFGQPLQLQLSRTITWLDINWALMIGAMLFSFALFKLTQAYLEQKFDRKNERLTVLRQLEEERNLLESHVTQRTQELNEQLLENQRLAHRVMEVQEHERRHLARELHDELGQSLTAIRTDARMLKHLHPHESSSVYQSADSIDAIAQHIYGVTYDLMRYLRPTSLDDLGLVDALRECITNLRVNEHNIKLKTSFSGMLNEMPETYNITLYRVVQESLTNTLRHASASQITIELHRREDEVGDYLEMYIHDDGQGFISNSDNGEGGFGLIGMRERINALGGRFNIQSTPYSGTQVEVVIPLPPNEEEDAEELAISSPTDEAALLY